MKGATGFLTMLGTATLSIFLMQSAQAEFIENNYICEDAYMEVAYDCGNDAIVVEKNRLNKIYKSVYRTLNKAQQQQLDKEQRIWLKHRNEPPRVYRRLIYLSQAAMPDRIKLS